MKRRGTAVKQIPVNAEMPNLRENSSGSSHPAKRDQIRFVLVCAFAYATHQGIRLLRKYLDDDGLPEALDRAPLGITDPRSWSYWNVRLGRYPPTSQSRRFTGWRGAV